MSSPPKLQKLVSAQSQKSALKKQPQKQSAIQILADKLAPETYTLEQVKDDYKNQTKMYQTALQNVQNNLKGRPMRNYDVLVGRKMRRTILSELGIDYKDVTVQDQKALDFLLIEDDFISALTNMAKTAGKYVKPLIKPVLRTVAPELIPMIEHLLPSSNTVNTSESVRVSRRYLLTPVIQGQSGQVYSIDCNPGLLQFGQWLSIIAKAFQYYKVHSVTFEYVTSTSLTTQGSITYYLEMDKNAPAPGAQDIGQQYKVTQHALFEHSSVTYNDEEIHQMVKRFHVRNESISPEEQSIYDFGTFYYYCSNQSATQYGQFFINIDVSFHVPTLQTAYSDMVSQFGLSVESFLFPSNNLFSPTNVTRTLNGTLCIAYTCLVTGTLYFYYAGKGTNTNAVDSLTIGKANHPSETPTYAGFQYTQAVPTAGTRMISTFGSLIVAAGQTLYFPKNGSGETYNQMNFMQVTLNPRNLPYSPLSLNGVQSKKQIQRNVELFMDESKIEKQLLQQKLDMLQNQISKLMMTKPPALKRQNAQIEEETEFSF